MDQGLLISLNPVQQSRRGVLSLLLILLVLLSACGATPSSDSSNASHTIKYGGAVTIVPGPYGTFTRNFNPFINDNASLSGTRGMLYETLLYFNRVDNTITPWLATKYTWSGDLKTLTFQIRHGVTWSDGRPLTSDDVAFTLNFLHQNPVLDSNSIWTFTKSVTSVPPDKVVIAFNKPSTPILWYIAGQTYIVPRHVWQQVKDPVKQLNPNPIGSGPFILRSFDPTLYTLGRNPDYWQHGKPYIDALRYPAYKSNANANLLLAQGSIDWIGIFSSDLQQGFVNRDPAHNFYWLPPLSVVMLYLNTTKYPFNLVQVRRAMSLVIDRQKLSKQAESGYEPPAHPTGLVLPAHEEFLNSNYKSASFVVNVAKAITLLESVGFHRQANGIFADNEGKPLAFTLKVVSGWSDWEIAARLIAKDLQGIGMQVTVETPQLPDYLTSIQMGNFDTAISWTNSGPSPYFLYYSLLASVNTAPIGKPASSNWERWNDRATDNLMAQYTNSIDKTVQNEALAGIQKIMVEQLPAIPLVYNVNWYEYTTARFEGWPNQNNTYALPAPYTYPDSEQVALHLHQV
jgi:peptide/nickel transport system substrate-binding protein